MESKPDDPAMPVDIQTMNNDCRDDHSNISIYSPNYFEILFLIWLAGVNIFIWFVAIFDPFNDAGNHKSEPSVWFIAPTYTIVLFLLIARLRNEKLRARYSYIIIFSALFAIGADVSAMELLFSGEMLFELNKDGASFEVVSTIIVNLIAYFGMFDYKNYMMMNKWLKHNVAVGLRYIEHATKRSLRVTAIAIAAFIFVFMFISAIFWLFSIPVWAAVIVILLLLIYFK